MSNIQLSKDANYLICIIYKYYLELHDISAIANFIDKIKP